MTEPYDHSRAKEDARNDWQDQTGCPVDGCNLVGPHDSAAHDWTASPEARAANYLDGGA